MPHRVANAFSEAKLAFVYDWGVGFVLGTVIGFPAMRDGIGGGLPDAVPRKGWPAVDCEGACISVQIPAALGSKFRGEIPVPPSQL